MNMNNKKVYMHPELSVKVFASNDVITASDNDLEWPDEWNEEE